MQDLDAKLYQHKGIRIIVLLLSVCMFIFLSAKIHEYWHWMYAYCKGYKAYIVYEDIFGTGGVCYVEDGDRLEFWIGGLGTFATMIVLWFLIWIYPTDNTVPLELGALMVAFSNLFYGCVEGLFLGVNDQLYHMLKYPAHYGGYALAIAIYWRKVILFVKKGQVGSGMSKQNITLSLKRGDK